MSPTRSSRSLAASSPREPRRFRVIDSPIGPLTLAGDGDTLTNLSMEAQTHLPRGLDSWIADDGGFEKVVEQLDAYFAGARTEFDIALRMDGTDFQRQVWAALLGIPYGETASYGEIAEEIGRPTASRAVGMANGRNPLAIIVPCHRVIGSSGSLVGYGGGLDRKQTLLDLERAHHQPRLDLGTTG
jgi:methylated-DNA-[protein]-cysteine S-methyltransferase